MLIAAGALLALSPTLCRAADEATATPAPAPAAGPAAESEVVKLRADIAELKERVDDLAAAADAKASASDSTLTIRGFGDIQFRGSAITPKPGAASSTATYHADTFSQDTLDIFMNARLGANISFLSETAFEAKTDNQLGVDVERLLVKYDFGDYLNVQVGRYHTSLGYWNDTYHHGEWLNTTINKPVAINFEDSGGVIPSHNVGISLAGALEVSEVEFDWALQVGNGRGPTSDPPQIYYGNQVPKALNVNLGVRPLVVPGLKIGGSMYVDHISPDLGTDPNFNPGVTPLHGALHETIVNGYAVYKFGSIETFAEIYQITHQRVDNFDGHEGMKDKDFAYYWQFGYKIGKWTPYARYDVLQISQDNDYYNAYRDSTRTIAVGLRWDVSSYNALKIQYSHIRHSSYLPGPNIVPVYIGASLVAGNATEDSLALQTCFAF